AFGLPVREQLARAQIDEGRAEKCQREPGDRARAQHQLWLRLNRAPRPLGRVDDRVAILEGSASRIQLESGRLDTIDERVVRGEPETDLLLRVSDLRVLVLARIDFRLNDDRRRPADFAGGRIDVAALPQL